MVNVSVISKKVFDKKDTIFFPYFVDYKSILAKFNEKDSKFIENYIKDTDFSKKSSDLIKLPELESNLLICGIEDLKKSIGFAIRKYKNRIDSIIFDMEMLKTLISDNKYILCALTNASILGSYSKNMNSDFNYYTKLKNVYINCVEQDVSKIRNQLNTCIENSTATLNTRIFANKDFRNLNIEDIAYEFRKNISKKIKWKNFKLKEIKSNRLHGLIEVSKYSDEEPQVIIAENKPEKGKLIVFVGTILIKPLEKEEVLEKKFLSSAILKSILQNYSEYDYDFNIAFVLTIAKVDEPQKLIHKQVRLASNSIYELKSKSNLHELLLADSIYQASKYKPKLIISINSANFGFGNFVGKNYASYITNSEIVSKKLEQASKLAKEDSFRLPLGPKLEIGERKTFELKNVNKAESWLENARLLQINTFGYPWVHFDLSANSYSDKDVETYSKGSTGFGAALLNEYMKILFEK